LQGVYQNGTALCQTTVDLPQDCLIEYKYVAISL